jgi:hypothetical protein
LHFWQSSNDTWWYPAKIEGFTGKKQTDHPDIFTRQSLPEPPANLKIFPRHAHRLCLFQKAVLITGICSKLLSRGCIPCW